MNRRRFFQAVSALGLPALVPAAVAGARARCVRIQESPLAGFQYHDGQTVWSRLREGDPLTLAREPLIAWTQRLREAANPWSRIHVVVEWDPYGVPRPLT